MAELAEAEIETEVAGGAHIHVEDAVVRTAAISIKALTVNGRQVTQALFRQLVKESLMAEDYTLRGIPWGWVNHHPAKLCPTEWLGYNVAEHRHVIWQKGDELRRDDMDISEASLNRRLSNGLKRLDPGYLEKVNQRMRTYYKRVKALPQLFIAV